MPSSAACSKSLDERAHERLGLHVDLGRLFDELDAHLEVRLVCDVLDDAEALLALDERLGGAVRQLELLHDRDDATDLVEVLGPGVLRLGLLLRRERDVVALAHGLLERLDRLLATDEQRHDEVREHDEVPQRNQGEHVGDDGALVSL